MSNKTKLKNLLENLVSRPIKTKGDLSAWYKSAYEIETFAEEFGIELPEVIWHYLSDADIRLKDPDYGTHQTESVHIFIQEISESKNA